MRGQGSVDVAYSLHDKKGRRLRQHVLAKVGQQMYPNYNHEGLITNQPLYPAEYYKLQFDGQLPSGRRLDKVGYLLNFSGRDNYGSEFYMNPNEVMRLNTYSASLYAKRRGLTTGLTWATNHVRHNELEFSRNLIDQDGESMEPWMADGETHELSWALTYNRPLLSWLSITVDGYNSLLHFRPSEETFGNEVYAQHMLQAESTPLYRYDWRSSAFTGGLLENRVALKANHRYGEKLELKGDLGVTLDGMLLADRTKVSPNLYAHFALDWQPLRWLQVGLSLGHDRVSYNIEDLRYMSRDYLNADVFVSGTNQLLTTT